LEFGFGKGGTVDAKTPLSSVEVGGLEDPEMALDEDRDGGIAGGTEAGSEFTDDLGLAHTPHPIE